MVKCCHLHRHYHHNFPCHSHYSFITKILSPNQLPHKLRVEQLWQFQLNARRIFPLPLQLLLTTNLHYQTAPKY
jgi:hypothetical protein